MIWVNEACFLLFIEYFSFISEPKKDKLENGGELMRPERPNSLTGKIPRRICYQGDVGMYLLPKTNKCDIPYE